MSKLFLLRAGEYMLKKGTKPFFEKQLKKNLKLTLKPYIKTIIMREGRIYIEHKLEHEEAVEHQLSHTFGIADYHKAWACSLNLADIKECLNQLLQSYDLLENASFKIEAKRSNKSFALTSYQLAVELGGYLLEKQLSWQVNVQKPELTFFVEIREQAYIYLQQAGERRGAGGLPVGSTGRGLLMLSGGIDSPVAGYLMAKRGLNLVAVHFHTPPYTGEEALDKVKSLARQLSPWNRGKLALYTVNFTPLQLQINTISKSEFVTIVSRIVMMRVAKILMQRELAMAIVTGEVLAQVASQTLESLAVTDTLSEALVLRPCTSMDKNEVINLARAINTFETSIIPAADCCSLFSPKHPSTRPKLKEVQELLAELSIDQLIDQAANEAIITVFTQNT